mgnify:CR=1 FL=1
MEIQKLEKSFTGGGEVKGCTFHQIAEFEKCYIYAKVKNGYTTYEAFEKKNVSVCIDFEARQYSDTEFKERYPKSKDFGSWAWECFTVERAIDILKLKELIVGDVRKQIDEFTDKTI